MTVVFKIDMQLAFTRPRNPTADYSQQPLAFYRALGQGDSGGGNIEPDALVGISTCWQLNTTPPRITGLCINALSQPKLTALDYWDTVSPVVGKARCLKNNTAFMPRLTACENPLNTPSKLFCTCLKTLYQAMIRLWQCETPQITGTGELFSGCLKTVYLPVNLLKHCHTPNVGVSFLLADCWQETQNKPQPLRHCERGEYKGALAIPCEYYPIEIPDIPPEPPVSPCDERPPANELPLTFIRQRLNNKASHLPLPFVCVWRDEIPDRDSYMIENDITAELADGTPLNMLDASIYASMDGFCWQFTATLYPDDFAKLQMDAREHGNECVVKISVNGELWVFIAEDYSDNRAFGRKTYTVQGRSLTAKLGADYAKTQNSVIERDLYARQIADRVLDLLPFGVGSWLITDWLVKANAYALQDMTPIAVLGDIANAAGGFVESDKALAVLHFKPKWHEAAWQVANTRPALTLPASIIESISGQKQISTVCNGVFVMGDDDDGVGADVYRQGTDRNPRLSVLAHSLYTDLPVCRAAGIAALSATGTHKIETVRLPFAADYGVRLPELGEVVQVNEATGYWRGVICGIRLDLTVENNTPVVYLSLTVDRYLDA